MAATTHPDGEVQTYECAHCGGDRLAGASVAGSFCSTDCYQAHRRSKRAGEILELLEHDHRFCRSCFAQLKEVSKPPRTLVVPPSLHDEDWGNASDVLVGFQYRTPNAETGEKSLDVDDDADRPIVEDGVVTGTVCCCGATDTRDSEAALREAIPWQTLTAHLATSVETLRREDKHSVDVDEHTLEAEIKSGTPARGALKKAVVLDG